MVIGFDETLDERLEHLERTRAFQDETGGLFSFLCWTYKPYGTAFGGVEVSAEEYRRWIALSRIFLDNVKHIRTSVLTQNEDAFRALDYGADDFDLPIEDEVTQKAGARSTSTSTRCSKSRAGSAIRSSTGAPSAPPHSLS
jgi:cyclic dehypoxanthinyl futalosine synthase